VKRRLHRTAIALGAALLVGGCTLSQAPILDPKGPVALAERDLLIIAAAVMMIVLIPVFVMALLFSWRYRASNRAARYAPDWSQSASIEAVVWIVPGLIVISLGVLLASATYRLDPYRPIDAAAAPLEVDVVGQDWKWLFIYPEQGIATVNELVFPSTRALSLRITSDTVMNSFAIPALGGQIYAMAGMETRLNLLADTPGRFEGRNMQYSGKGFPNQHFQAIATTPADFDSWLAKAKQSPDKLDASTYRALAAASINHPVTYYSAIEPGLFRSIIAKYMRGPLHSMQHAAQ
jgi:cytochrome o ubiquinol oxidase subunit II